MDLRQTQRRSEHALDMPGHEKRTDGAPCHHWVDFTVEGFSGYASWKDATVGDVMGSRLSSVLVLDRLRRGEDGSEEYGDSFCAT